MNKFKDKWKYIIIPTFIIRRKISKNILITEIQKNTTEIMNYKTKERIIKMIIYAIIGFAIAFFWHKMKEK